MAGSEWWLTYHSLVYDEEEKHRRFVNKTLDEEGHHRKLKSFPILKVYNGKIHRQFFVPSSLPNFPEAAPFSWNSGPARNTIVFAMQWRQLSARNAERGMRYDGSLCKLHDIIIFCLEEARN